MPTRLHFVVTRVIGCTWIVGVEEVVEHFVVAECDDEKMTMTRRRRGQGRAEQLMDVVEGSRPRRSMRTGGASCFDKRRREEPSVPS